jgi:hypothetical protein
MSIGRNLPPADERDGCTPWKKELMKYILLFGYFSVVFNVDRGIIASSVQTLDTLRASREKMQKPKAKPLLRPQFLHPLPTVPYQKPAA